MNDQQRIAEIQKRLKRGEYYVPHAPDDIAFLLSHLASVEAERDAAKAMLKGKCWACKHGKPIPNIMDNSSLNIRSSLRSCEHLKPELVYSTGKNDCEYWELIGTEEEEQG